MAWKLTAVAISAFAYIYRAGFLPDTFKFLSQTTSTMSTKQNALFLLEPQGQYAIQTKDIPEPGAGEVIVQIYATALNPVDWKIHDYGIIFKSYPAILGTDSSGVITKVGEGVASFAVGDKVCV